MTLFFVEEATLKGRMGSKADDTDEQTRRGLAGQVRVCLCVYKMWSVGGCVCVCVTDMEYRGKCA